MGFGSEIIDFYQDRLWGLWGVGTDSISAFGCWVDGLPGFEGLGFVDRETGELHPYILSKMSKNSVSEEPYIFHFPDGNATVARLLVRKMLPNASTEAPWMILLQHKLIIVSLTFLIKISASA